PWREGAAVAGSRQGPREPRAARRRRSCCGTELPSNRWLQEAEAEAACGWRAPNGKLRRRFRCLHSAVWLSGKWVPRKCGRTQNPETRRGRHARQSRKRRCAPKLPRSATRDRFANSSACLRHGRDRHLLRRPADASVGDSPVERRLPPLVMEETHVDTERNSARYGTLSCWYCPFSDWYASAV